jgi:hypothetical protein
MRLIEHFDRGAERFPERAFLVDEYGSLSYAAAGSHHVPTLARGGFRPAPRPWSTAPTPRSFDA